MNPYADTNFITQLYLGLTIDDETSIFRRATRKRQQPKVPVTWLHQSEVCNAMQLYVFRARAGSGPRVTPEHSAAAWGQFREEVRTGRLRATILPPAELAEQSEQLSLRHTARHGFRTYDLLHVASALLLRCDWFWSFDVKASRLAKLEGLRTFALGK